MQQDDLTHQIEKSLAMADPMVPKTYAKAMKAPDAAEWREACLAELNQMCDMKVLEFCDFPLDRRMTDAKLVFCRKREGSYKVAPTATFAALRILITIAVKMGWMLYGFDVMAAYLLSQMDHDVWVR